jgi:hypothetical protein
MKTELEFDDDGMIKCSECEGDSAFCPKCLGKGKVDWVSNVMKKQFYTIVDDTSAYTFVDDTSAYTNACLSDECMDDIAKRLADHIDEKVIELLSKKVEQNLIKKFSQKGGIIF